MLSTKLSYEAHGEIQAANLIYQFFESYMYKLYLRVEIKKR